MGPAHKRGSVEWIGTGDEKSEDGKVERGEGRRGRKELAVKGAQGRVARAVKSYSRDKESVRRDGVERWNCRSVGVSNTKAMCR